MEPNDCTIACSFLLPGTFLDEQDFLETIGWIDDETPFTVGLRLNEPDFDGDDWKIELFLRDKKTVICISLKASVL